MATPAVLQEDRDMATARRPTPSRLWIQATLLVVTLFSTTIVGMRYMANFQQGKFPLASDADIFPYAWVFANLRHISIGLPFSLTLLAILLTHEFGHYLACRHYGIRATLPYLLPAPSLSGTAGAVIRLKSRVNSRTAILSIGAIGPFAGFLVALATSCLGFYLSALTKVPPQRLVDFSSPLLFQLLERYIVIWPPNLWHPVLLASWIGLLITSLNLLPAGQLDGGHILYALSPRAHRLSTYAVMAGLVYCGITIWLGWLLWAALLWLPGMRHPTVSDPAPISRKVLWLAPVSLVILILTATPEPFSHSSLIEAINRMRH